ncbi:MAG: membrane protein insertion efficiency factor YidD [Actinomycetota bacterium]
MRRGNLSPASRFAIPFIRTYQLEVSHRLGARCGGTESCSEYALRMFERHSFMVAVARTLVRVMRCRPARNENPLPSRNRSRIRRLAAVTSLLGILGVFGVMFSAPAIAENFGPCYGKANEQRFAEITRNAPVRVRLSQRIALSGGSYQDVSKYVVRLYYFGIPYAIRGGTTTDNKWQGSVTASQFLTRGTGNYIAEGILVAGAGDTTRCIVRLYIKVIGDPLSEPMGQAAGGVTLGGILGMVATAVKGGKSPPGFDDTATPEQEDEIKELQEEEAKREEQRKKQEQEDEENKSLAKQAEKKCLLLVLPALLLTAGMVAAGGTATSGHVPARTAPRVHWRPRLSVLGIASGLLFSLGSGVLLQQYGVIWPSLSVGITFLVGGIVIGVLVPSLTRLRVVRRMNRRFEAIERARATVPWMATHAVPADGASVWDQPDPSLDAREEVAGGLQVRLVESRGDWARVTAENAWTGWVDARRLEAVQAPAEPAPAIEAAAEETGEAADIPADWYPDPAGEARLRYWDGSAWTEHTAV